MPADGVRMEAELRGELLHVARLAAELGHEAGATLVRERVVNGGPVHFSENTRRNR
jgi:hypothetical protein